MKTILKIGFISVLTIILIGGTLGVVETNKLYNISKEATVKNAPLADAAMEITISVLKAQLWFEEIISGTKKPEIIGEVWNLFDEGLWYVNAMVSGGQNEKNTFHPVNDKAIEVKVLVVKTNIEALQEIAKMRLDNFLTKQKLNEQELIHRFETAFNK